MNTKEYNHQIHVNMAKHKGFSHPGSKTAKQLKHIAKSPLVGIYYRYKKYKLN